MTAEPAIETRYRKCEKCGFWCRVTEAMGVCRRLPPHVELITQNLVVPAIDGNYEVVSEHGFEILPGSSHKIIQAGTVVVIPPPMKASGYCHEFSPEVPIS